MDGKIDVLASGTFFLTVMQVLGYAGYFAFYVLAARLLTTSEVGSFSLLLMVLTVFSTGSLLALNNAVVKFFSEGLGREDEEWAASAANGALRLIAFSSTTSLILGLAFSPLISSFAGVGLLEVSCILVSAFIYNFTSYLGAVMYGYRMFREVCLQNVIYVFSCRSIGLMLAFLGLRVLGVSFGFLAGSTLTLICSIAFLRGRDNRSNKVFPYSRLLKFSLPVYGYNIVSLLQSWLDVGLLSSVAGLDVAGTYYIAVSSVTFLSVLWQPLSQALLPTLSWMNGSGYADEITKIARSVLRIMSAIILPLSFGLASVPRTALSIVYGTEYARASLAFSLLAFSAFLNAYTSFYGAVLQALGRTKPILAAGAASTLIYVFMLATLSPVLGQVGAALARMLMTTVGFLILQGSVSIGLPENLKKCVLTALVVSAVLLPTELLWEVTLPLKVSVELLEFAAVSLLAHKTFKPMSSVEIASLKSLVPWKPRGR
ncbi:MAG: oligosaccharide flippase family protein [Thermoproteota archaeon]